MDWKELINKSRPELERLLAAQRERLRDLRFKVAQSQHKDVRDLRAVKKDIARLLTKIKQSDQSSDKSPSS
jgi:ribosomal protein L29